MKQSSDLDKLIYFKKVYKDKILDLNKEIIKQKEETINNLKLLFSQIEILKNESKQLSDLSDLSMSDESEFPSWNLVTQISLVRENLNSFFKLASIPIAIQDKIDEIDLQISSNLEFNFLKTFNDILNLWNCMKSISEISIFEILYFKIKIVKTKFDTKVILVISDILNLKSSFKPLSSLINTSSYHKEILKKQIEFHTFGTFSICSTITKVDPFIKIFEKLFSHLQSLLIIFGNQDKDNDEITTILLKSYHSNFCLYLSNFKESENTGYFLIKSWIKDWVIFSFKKQFSHF